MKTKRKNDNTLSVRNFKFDGSKIVKQKTTSENGSPKAVIYCRVSGDRQMKEGFGIETQEKLCRERCANQKPPIEVVKVFRDEAISGNKNDRAGYEQLVAFLKQENSKYIKITHFVCRELSRISRPDLDAIGDAFDMEGKVKQYGVQICDIQGGAEDESDEGKLMKVIKYAFAGYERNRTNRLTQNGRRARLLMGYWPFPSLPLGYKRTYIGKSYVDEIDETKGYIIKQALELYANDPTMTPGQLYHYLNDKGLTTESISKKADNTIYRTYIEKMFQVHRLYFYAGYIIYPSRDINELVEGRHEGIISLATANKIKDKLQLKTRGIKTMREDDFFILRGLISCIGCKRTFTGWPTSKTNKNTGEKKYYNYYGCQCNGCKERVTIPKDILEEQALSMIREIQLPEEMQKLFEAVFDASWKQATQNQKLEQDGMQKRTKELLEKMESIKKTLMKLDPVMQDALFKSYSEDYAKYSEEVSYIQGQLENKQDAEKEKRIILAKTKELIKSPLSFWEMGDNALRKLLFKVRFGDTLRYSKEGGLQTSQTPSLYSVLCDFKLKFTRLWACRDSNPGPVA